MWAQEHEVRTSHSWLDAVAKSIPIVLILIELVVGSAFCQVAPAPDTSSEQSASRTLPREAFDPGLSAGALSQQTSSQVPNAPSVSSVTAPMQANSGRCAESLSLRRHALEISSNNDSMALTLARDLARCGQLNEAVSRYRQYLGTHAGAEDVLAELGDILLRAQQPADAMDVFRALLAAHPQSMDAHLGLARALARRGDYPEALRHYEFVLGASPENYDALQGKAFALYWGGRLEPAKALFQRLLAVRPQDPENREALKRLGEVEEAARWEALRPGRDAPPARCAATMRTAWLLILTT